MKIFFHPVCTVICIIGAYSRSIYGLDKSIPCSGAWIMAQAIR